MPVGDKNFNDLVEYTEELILACDVGYWRDTWSTACDKMNKLYAVMCRKFKTTVGWRTVCNNDCPFHISEDNNHVCCISRDWYKGHLFANVYRMSGGSRNLNTTYRDLTQCKGTKEDLQIFLNELLAGYWEKERVAKPPGTSASKTTYTIATSSEIVVDSNSTSTTVVTSPGTYDTNTILGASASTTTPEPDDDDDDDAEEDDGNDEPEHIWTCDWCGSEFNEEDDYDAHLDNNHPFCDLCETRFENTRLYLEHMPREHPDEAAEDNTTLQAGIDAAALARGETVVVNGPISLIPGAVLNGHEPAEIRGVVFEQARPARRVIRAQTPHMFDCNVCGEQFFNERSLRGHILLDHPAAVHRCLVCGFRFDRADLLGTHVALAHGR